MTVSEHCMCVCGLKLYVCECVCASILLIKQTHAAVPVQSLIIYTTLPDPKQKIRGMFCMLKEEEENRASKKQAGKQEREHKE